MTIRYKIGFVCDYDRLKIRTGKAFPGILTSVGLEWWKAWEKNMEAVVIVKNFI